MALDNPGKQDNEEIRSLAAFCKDSIGFFQQDVKDTAVFGLLAI
jgi:hypothetical protein